VRLSRLLGRTLRQPPSDARLPSHQLLARAGYVRGLEAGRFAFLPLGQRSMARLRSLIRCELSSLGVQEVDASLPLEAEPKEVMVHLVRREVDSYRQVPTILLQMSTRPSDQWRSRTGLFGASERTLAEVYAFGGADLPVASRVVSTLERIFAVCELEPVWAEAGEGGQRAYVLHSTGDEDLALCPACGYAAERSWAKTLWGEPPAEPEQPPEEIATPGCDTIASLAEFLAIPTTKTLKMVFCSVEGKVTCVVIRGDRAVDEGKLARLLGTDQHYASLEDELAAIGAVGGYASPIGLDDSKVRVVADPSVRSGRNFVSGANRPGYHIRNVNVPRDFDPGEWVDLAQIEEGDPCPGCGGELEKAPGFVLVSSAGTGPCKPEAEYLNTDGRPQPLWLASWRLDLTSLLAATVEAHHDDYGILWPMVCAPYDLHLVALDVRKETVAAQAEALYERLSEEGWAVLYDDREASAGVKFNDADLIGLPLRLTVSKRSVKEGLVEAKWRNSRERLKLDEDGLTAELARLRQG
jgi:prolyl-tRNA synthetase